ncbi:hypothetical protein SEA_GAZEBO_48 [Microbacterium phage Gazebo]|nr:hypothetical protein SEA_GAZEBO_48 [Microbacterium phage Gazebo]
MPEPMPWALKLDLIMAILGGEYRSISYFSGVYRFEVEPNAVKRWRKRRDRRAIAQARRDGHV